MCDECDKKWEWFVEEDKKAHEVYRKLSAEAYAEYVKQVNACPERKKKKIVRR